MSLITSVVPLLTRTEPVVTFVRLQRPELDLVSLVLGAFRTTGFFVVLALVIGAVLGIHLIVRRGRAPEPEAARLDLHQR